MIEKQDKAFRLLQLHEGLSRGEPIIKNKTLTHFGIDEKTFQRDISSLRQYYSNYGKGELTYDRKRDCYRLTAKTDSLTKEEIFAVCKVLVESRALNKMEFNTLIEKLLRQCDDTETKMVKRVIANEQVNYIPLHHGKPLVNRLWQLSDFVKEQIIIDITYKRTDGTIRRHEVKPVGIMFSEFYFYLIAYMSDDRKDSPTVFRIDRISTVKKTDQLFTVPYAKRFSESEFRKRVQFMYPSEITTIRFRYTGPSLEAVLDRIPTATVVRECDGGYEIRAEVFGGIGFDMWVRSQGNWLEII